MVPRILIVVVLMAHVKSFALDPNIESFKNIGECSRLSQSEVCQFVDEKEPDFLLPYDSKLNSHNEMGSKFEKKPAQDKANSTR